MGPFPPPQIILLPLAIIEYLKKIPLSILYWSKSQIKGKESENSYQELKRSQDRHTQTHSDWEWRPCQSKYLDTISMCLCVLVLLWSLQFLVRVFISFPFICDFHTSVLSFPRGLYIGVILFDIYEAKPPSHVVPLFV